MRPDEIQRALERVLAREEFSGLARDGGGELRVLGELFEALFSALQAMVSDLGSSHPELWTALLILGTGVLAAGAYFGARAAARRSRGGARLAEVPELLRGDPLELQREAREHAAAGRWLPAVRLCFRATIIEQALAEGLLFRRAEAGGFRRARTYRELVHEFGRQGPRAERMAALAERIERALYAGEALGPADWAQAVALAEEAR